jgi:pSer/pThr/pTyr-binding forkhead associated (FHA) protein
MTQPGRPVGERTPAYGQPITGARPQGQPLYRRAGRPVVGVLAVLAAAGLLAGELLPIVSQDGDPSEGLLGLADSSFAVFTFIVTVLLVAGGVVATMRPAAAGMVGGAALVGGTTGVVFSALFFYGVSESDGDVTPASGLYVLTAGSVIALVTFIAAVARPTRMSRRSAVLGAVAVPGALASIAASVGLMLPPPGSDLTVSEYLNLGNVGVNIANIGWMASLAVAATIGFVARSRWGILMVIGAWLPMAWLLFSAATANRIEFDAGGDGSVVVRADVHPLFALGIVGVGVCALIGLIAGRSVAVWNEPAPAVAGEAAFAHTAPAHTAPAHTAPAHTAYAPTTAVATGRWAADPYGRHELRYWDGQSWTMHVSDRGATSVDPPQWTASSPTPSPTAPTAATTATTDPTATPPAGLLVPGARGPAGQPTKPAGGDAALETDTTTWIAPRRDDATVITPSGATRRTSVVLDDGTRTPLAPFLLVGRDPSAGAGDPPASLWPISDPDRSVSSTHLALGTDGHTVWAADRGSSNGSSIVRSDGSVLDLVPHQPVTVPDGATIRIGRRTLRVER